MLDTLDLTIVQNKEFGELEVVQENGKYYFPATSVATVLGYKNPQKAIRDHCKDNGVTWRSVATIRGVQKKKFISEDNVVTLINGSKLITTKEKERLLASLYTSTGNKLTVVNSRDEVEFYHALRTVLKQIGLTVESQYKVDKYYVDIYIPELNLAIEFDEDLHKGYDNNAECEREYVIFDVMGVDMLRLNGNDDALMNIGKVVGCIMDNQRI